jgi:anti-sigma factor RsiW
MECPYTGQIGAYLDGELDAAQRRGLEAHLSSCAACARESGEVRSLKALFAAAEYPALTGPAIERLHDQAESLYERGTLRIAQALSGLAACLLIAGSLWLTQSQTQPDTRAEVQPSAATAAYAQADPLIPVELAEPPSGGGGNLQVAADPGSAEAILRDLSGQVGSVSDEEVR